MSQSPIVWWSCTLLLCILSHTNVQCIPISPKEQETLTPSIPVQSMMETQTKGSLQASTKARTKTRATETFDQFKEKMKVVSGISSVYDPHDDPCYTTSAQPCLLPFIVDNLAYRACQRQLPNVADYPPAIPNPNTDLSNTKDLFECPTTYSNGVFGSFQQCRPTCLYDDEPPCAPKHCRLSFNRKCSARAYDDPACLADPTTLGCDCPSHCAAVDSEGTCTACEAQWRFVAETATCVPATCLTLSLDHCTFPFTVGPSQFFGCWQQFQGSLRYTFCTNTKGQQDQCDRLCPEDTHPICPPKHCHRNGICSTLAYDDPACGSDNNIVFSYNHTTCDCQRHCTDMHDIVEPPPPPPPPPPLPPTVTLPLNATANATTTNMTGASNTTAINGTLLLQTESSSMGIPTIAHLQECSVCEPGYALTSDGKCADNRCLSTSGAQCIFPYVFNNERFTGCQVASRTVGNSTQTDTYRWCFTTLSGGVYGGMTDCASNCPSDTQGDCDPDQSILSTGHCSRHASDPLCATDTPASDCPQPNCLRLGTDNLCVACYDGFVYLPVLRLCIPQGFDNSTQIPFCYMKPFINPNPPKPKTTCPPGYPIWDASLNQCLAECPADQPNRIGRVCYAPCANGYTDQHPYCNYPATASRGMQYRCDPCNYALAVQTDQSGCNCDYGYFPLLPYKYCQCHTHRYLKPQSAVNVVAPSCTATQTESGGQCYDACPTGFVPVMNQDPTYCQSQCPSGESLTMCFSSSSSATACGRNPTVCQAGLKSPVLTLQSVVDVASSLLPSFFSNGKYGDRLFVTSLTSLQNFGDLQAFVGTLKRDVKIIQYVLRDSGGAHQDTLAAINQLTNGLNSYNDWQIRTMSLLLNSNNPLTETVDFTWPECAQPFSLVDKMQYNLLTLFGALASTTSPAGLP